MWRSSCSNACAGRRRAPRGFTLLEAMVSLILLVIILTVAMTMLFQMRAFAERQQYFMLPRQAARRAADYLSFYLAGASDINYVDTTHPSPNALIMYYNLNGATTQASYNNLTGPESRGTGSWRRASRRRSRPARRRNSATSGPTSSRSWLPSAPAGTRSGRRCRRWARAWTCVSTSASAAVAPGPAYIAANEAANLTAFRRPRASTEPRARFSCSSTGTGPGPTCRFPPRATARRTATT